jgi:hypothetical protein
LFVYDNGQLITKGYELAVHDILVIGTGAQLKIEPKSVLKVDGIFLIKDGVSVSIEAREVVIGPNDTCIATTDTLITESVHVSDRLAIESILHQNFSGSPTVAPGLFCYSFYGSCEEWNALNELFFDPQKLENKIPCDADGVGNSTNDGIWF